MKIPFALKDGKYVDVSEVDKGRACGCICPSCKQPLVAKKGINPENRVHHFAHDKKAKMANGEKIECDYSFFVAARLVIKQSLWEMPSFKLFLPAWLLKSELTDKHGKRFTGSAHVAKASVLTFTDFEIQPNGELQEIDIVGTFGKYSIGIHFSYPGRPKYKKVTESNDLSVLNIDLEPLLEIFNDKKARTLSSFKDLVLKYVLKSGSREWLTHARHQATATRLNGKLEELLERANKINSTEAQQKLACQRCKKLLPKLYVDDRICFNCVNQFHKEGLNSIFAIRTALNKQLGLPSH